jgi:hypothetical protein
MFWWQGIKKILIWLLSSTVESIVTNFFKKHSSKLDTIVGVEQKYPRNIIVQLKKCYYGKDEKLKIKNYHKVVNVALNDLDEVVYVRISFDLSDEEKILNMVKQDNLHQEQKKELEELLLKNGDIIIAR